MSIRGGAGALQGVARGLPALTLTTGGERPPSAFFDRPSRLDANRLGELGRAAQQLLSWLDSGVELAPGTASYVYFGPRILPGWALELVLIAALAPFMVAAVDLFARCRRRHIPLAPALRSYRSRAYFWLWTVAIFELFALVGVWPSAPAVPLPPDSSPASSWPVVGLLGLALLSGIGWFVTRERLLPRRPVSPSEELAGTAAALLADGFATTTLYDPPVVTSAATVRTTRNRQFSLHLLMIRPCWCVHLFHTGHRAHNDLVTKFP